jgi:hypothetical protein
MKLKLVVPMLAVLCVGCPEELPQAPEPSLPLVELGRRVGVTTDYIVVKDTSTDRRYLVVRGSNGALAVTLMAEQEGKP